jgi:DNA uptake protein ComE-like DNA-binding protein
MSSPIIRAAAAAALLAFPLQAQVGKSLGVLEANTAPEAEIAALPHMTPELAKELVAARPFLTTAAYDAFLGTRLTREQRTELYPRLFVHIDLNSATREEILLVPGIGPRMLREFLEYRPYRAMAQFRREMGKYVKEEEVARMEQYVFVPMDLNTASDEDLMTIPGFGPRMLREFKEYRPYRAIERFRREIGKYVNEQEVARLERYVEIREPQER